MVFVDSNVPMYLVGQPHANRDRLEQFLRSNPAELYATSAEVYQEVVHRFVAIDRRQAIQDCFDLLNAFVQTVYPITRDDAERAAAVSLAQRGLSGRDCLHIAVMERYGVERILTCDEDFDLWPGIVRLP